MTVTEARRAISRRPKPDVTGAIQHVRAAMEVTAWDLVGRSGNDNGSHLYPYPEWGDRQRASIYPQIASSARSLPTTYNSCLKNELTANLKD